MKKGGGGGFPKKYLRGLQKKFQFLKLKKNL